MIGVISSVCAITMPAGVNSHPSDPNTPLRDSSRYTTKPTTTGGKPIDALSTTTIGTRSRLSVNATHAPSGSAISAAISVAVAPTRSDNNVMSPSVESADSRS